MIGLGLALLAGSVGVAIQGAERPQGGAREFRGRRATARYLETIAAPPDRVFPLLCPIREAEWADGWVARVVYAMTGVAEADAVFATEREAGESDDTIWVVTRYDARAHDIEMVYFVPGVRVTKLVMAVGALPNGRSSLAITYTVTGLSDKGNAVVAAQFEDQTAFRERMSHWQEAMTVAAEDDEAGGWSEKWAVLVCIYGKKRALHAVRPPTGGRRRVIPRNLARVPGRKEGRIPVSGQ